MFFKICELDAFNNDSQEYMSETCMYVSFDVLDMSFFGNLLLAIFIGNYYSVT